jgi:hypothetical protein
MAVLSGAVSTGGSGPKPKRFRKYGRGREAARLALDGGGRFFFERVITLSTILFGLLPG